MNYVIFTSQGEPTTPAQCTTRWADNISVSIVLSGYIGGTFHNLMKMEGSISDWLSENQGKVVKVTKEEFNAKGQEIVPEGTTREYTDIMTGENSVLVAGVFDSDNPNNLWQKQ